MKRDRSFKWPSYLISELSKYYFVSMLAAYLHYCLKKIIGRIFPNLFQIKLLLKIQTHLIMINIFRDG